MPKGENKIPDWVKTRALLMVKYGQLAYRESGVLVKREQGVGSELWRLRESNNYSGKYEMRIPAIGSDECDKKEHIIIENLRKMEP